MDAYKPRVNGSMLGSYVGREVVLVAKVLSVGSNNLKVATSDSQAAVVEFDFETDPDITTFVELVGTVERNLTLKARQCTNLGNAFDLDKYNEAVLLMQKIPAPFQ